MLSAEERVRARFDLLAPVFNERQLRLWAAAEARTFGYGGGAIVTRATGMRSKRISRGQHDLDELQRMENVAKPQQQRVRRPGAGRKTVEEKDPTLWRDLEALVEPTTRGDPESPLRWTTKSTRNLAAELNAQGHKVSATTVWDLLRDHGYYLQGTRKTIEGKQHPDRDQQFEHINRETKRFQAAGQPVISVDTKKKELVGEFSNKGREWHAAGDPPEVLVHDFIHQGEGKAIPYGVYDVSRNEGWVNVGMDHDTAAFAVASIRSWWNSMGKRAYPKASALYIVADSGGSNGYRTRLWKTELQKFADESELELNVSHMPPGTSKWNKIEHRLFSHMSQNWRGRPLVDHATVVNLIAHTTTASGLKVRARLDRRRYPLKIKVSTATMRTLAIRPRKFHGEWNYKLSPRANS